MKPDLYDAFATSYARENETGLFNAYYARPAMLDLAGDVAGRSILDAGCGAGPLAAALRERGARVTGFDASPAMVALAQQRLGTDTPVLVADPAERLPISVVSAPPFLPETPRELLPPGLGDRTSFLCFLFFVLEAT